MPIENNATPAAPPAAAPVAKPTAAPVAPVAQVRVRVIGQAVDEGGKTYLKNQVLTVTAERAAELGEFVAIIAPRSTTAPFLVGARAIEEGGKVYQPGAAIALTADRATALGSLVKPAEATK